MAEEEINSSLEYTPTWVVALVCFVIVLLSLCAERTLHKLGKYLKHEEQDALFEALQKLKEELMLLGFISLLLTVSQRSIIRICIPSNLANHMLPCKRETSEGNNNAHYSLDQSINNRRRLLSADTNSDHCLQKGKAPLLSLEALHHLHIFIFVLAVVHVRQWKRWEDSVRQESTKSGMDPTSRENVHAQCQHHEFFSKRGVGYWRRAAIIGWVISFFKQFYGSVTKSDYIALRQGFIKYLWLFVVQFLLLNVEGWHTYFWLAFLPLIVTEHIIIRLAQEVTQGMTAQDDHEAAATVKPSDKHFWFNNPRIVLNLIHFILFQNSFEIAFFFWIWTTYGFHSCIMEKLGYIVPRLIMGVIVQVICSYSTLPLYTIVSQMGSMYKEGIFDQKVQQYIGSWVGDICHGGLTHGQHARKDDSES
ncbi:MLO-like protein 13 [Pyrus ussuriensis x Pyrus communis]|uniref:MLO-like protein n=1 Tax=Pyrus ussuriensis x Pyrus communis TaxID=2448454 RepID=A0A5N5HK45_9ROSA|nr:MLO-like protein 13 [Pyrus ussuriensis x Pyrus communis]